MEVIFGRGNGEQTRGVIEKINRTKAKVRTIESRGKTMAGTVWSVPYSLMTMASNSTVTKVTITKVTIPVPYSPFQDRVEQTILEAINMVYNELSPESLTCDGEANAHQIATKRSRLNRQLRGLFQAFGREIDEDVAFNWWKQKQEYQRNKQAHLSNS
jgi:hypothetical protein